MGENSKSDAVNPLSCPHCAGPLSKEMETSGWTVPPLVRDSFSMIGSAVGGITSAFYGYNFVMPSVHKRIKGPMWLQFLIGDISFPSSVQLFGAFGYNRNDIIFNNVTANPSVILHQCRELCLQWQQVLSNRNEFLQVTKTSDIYHTEPPGFHIANLRQKSSLHKESNSFVVDGAWGKSTFRSAAAWVFQELLTC